MKFFGEITLLVYNNALQKDVALQRVRTAERHSLAPETMLTSPYVVLNFLEQVERPSQC